MVFWEKMLYNFVGDYLLINLLSGKGDVNHVLRTNNYNKIQTQSVAASFHADEDYAACADRGALFLHYGATDDGAESGGRTYQTNPEFTAQSRQSLCCGHGDRDRGKGKCRD